MFKALVPLALCLAASAAQAAPVPLTIGDAIIRIPVDGNYVQLSSAQPKLFAFAQAGLPTTNRLVESLMTSDDVQRTNHGESAADIYYQVQVLRSVESRQMSVDDWNALKPQLTAGMAKADMNRLLADTSANNQRMSNVAGQKVDMSFGDLAAPVVYRETPQSVDFGMVVPLNINVNGQVVSTKIAAAGSFALVHNKLIYLYAFNPKSTPADVADVRHHLDDFVDQTLAMNPSDPATPSTGAFHFDWSSVGRSAALWGIIGVLIAGVGVVFGRRK